MSCTASPGISRGSVKTMAVAISSEGTATSSRRARYRLSTPPASPRASAVEPCGGQPPAEVVTQVGAVVLQRALPHRDAEPGVDRDVVLLSGQVALERVDDLAALRRVQGAALAQDQIRRHRILDVTLVARLAGQVLGEVAVGLEEVRLRAERHRIELADEARREVGAVLLLVEPRVDARLLELREDEPRLVDEDRRAVGREADVRRQPVAMAGGGEEAPGLGEVALVVTRTVAELPHGQRPVLEPGGNRGVEGAPSLGRLVHDGLAVHGQ